VAAKVSTLLALVIRAKVLANSVVNVIMAPSLASGLDTKYKIKIDNVGRRDERIVLIALATETKDDSLYFQSPLSSSGFCLDEPSILCCRGVGLPLFDAQSCCETKVSTYLPST
jgi:hypothetical protein